MASIALVDDEPSVLQVIANYLEATGHTVQAFSNGAEALDWLRGNSAELLIIDEKMPGMAGAEVISLSRAIKRSNQARSILMTGHPEVSGSMADGFLGKPFTPEELDAAIRRTVPALETGLVSETPGPHVGLCARGRCLPG